MLLTPLLWGATFPGGKLALEALNPFTFMAWSRVLGTLTIAVAMVRFGGLSDVSPRRVGGLGLLLGGLLFTGYVLQTLGLEGTTATNAGFITGLYVVFTPLLELVLFRRPAGPWVWIAVTVSVTGLGLLSTESTSSLRPRPGDLLVLASALAWAGHVVALAHFAPRWPTHVVSAAQLAVAALLHCIAAVPAGPQVDAALSVAPLLVLTGVLGTGVAFTLQIAAQKEIGAARAAVILAGESLVSALVSLVWLGERLRAHQWLGAALLVGAMVLSESTARRRE
jgi:drug/metabolite transporter (DMT)-like permease